MLKFEKDGKTFRYRVAGVALKDHKVLLYHGEDDDFWSIPGGIVEMMEPSEESLRREMQEEIGSDITINRLGWVLEFFFEEKGETIHEISLYYLVEAAKGSHADTHSHFTGKEGEETLTYQWFDIDGLDDLPVQPAFLKDRLKNIPEHPEHIVFSAMEPSELQT